MATWLKSANFSDYNGSHFYISLSYDLLGQSIQNNTSTVRYYLNIGSGDGYSASGSYSNAYINGSWVGGFTSIGRNTSFQVGYLDATINHGNDGKGTAYYSASASTNWSGLGSSSLSGSFTLPTIPRASTPSIDGTVYTNTSVTINTNRASTSFTHTLTYSFGSLTGTIGESIAATTTWTIPANFADQIPDSSSGTCVITCDTYDGSTKIGTKTYNKEIFVNASVVPTISAKSSSDGNSSVSSLNWGVYLINKSYPVLSITAAGVRNSTISTYYAGINQSSDADYDSTAVSGTTLSDLNSKVRNFVLQPGTNTIKVWVSDSRGYKSTKHSISITARAYSSPQITTFNVARCKSSTNLTEDDEGTYVKLSAAGSITDVKNSSNTSSNTMYVRTRYRTAPNGSWSALTALSGGTSGYSFDKTGTNSVNLAGTFATTSKFDIQIYIYDTVILKESGWSGSGTPTEAQLAKLVMMQKSILTGFDLMHFHKSGKSVAFGKKSEAGDNDKMFEIRMDQIKFDGVLECSSNIIYKGTLLDNLINSVETPIGTILPFGSSNVPSGYMVCDGRALSRTTYNELFSVIGTTYGSGDGSTTFNIPNLKGKVSVGLDSNDTSFDELGETGGEKEHTLTIKEIPSHNHSIIKPRWSTGAGANAMYGSNGEGAGSQYDHLGYQGGGQAHNNLQPYIVVNYIIKVARGNATVPASVTISNADVAQITTNKNAITALNNKIDTSNTYSSTEIVVGQWVDGKPIYRKVTKSDGIAGNGVNIAHGISNLKRVTKIEVSASDDSGTTYFPYNNAYDIKILQVNATYINANVSTGYSSGWPLYWIVEYTKTTD